jgi:16S rRNA (guanine527-N7)-methyltransferase
VTEPNPDTSPQTPPSDAEEVFGANFGLAQRYAAMLCGDGVVRGVIGPREPARIWTRHLLNGAALAPWLGTQADVADVGSGAGLPGIPLLLARPDLNLTLVEPMARRVAFLEDVRGALGLELNVLHARAQDVPRRSADVVVARAVAPLDRLIAMVFPLLRPGGQLLALKGDRAAEEVRSARGALSRARVAEAHVHAIGSGDDRTYVVAVTAPGSSATVST